MALANPHFEASYSRLFGPDVAMSAEADVFFERFYARFLEDPEIGRLFAGTDMARQVQMLKRSLFHLVSFYVTGVPNAELDRIRDVHRRLRVSHDMFDSWLEALVETVSALDEEADERTRLGWCWALAPGLMYMRMPAA